MKRISTIMGIFFLITLISSIQLTTALAQSDIMDAFKGKKIKFIVHYGPGGGYDSAARTLAPFIEKYTGARVVIVNIPGAGGLNGMNTLWKAKGDGLTIGLISGLTAVSNQMAGLKGVKFDLKNFAWLGRISPTPFVFAVSSSGQFKSIEDVLKADRPLKIGTTGRGNAITVAAQMTSEAIGMDIKLILGFNSTAEIFVSIMRGDIDGVTTVRDTVLSQVRSGLITPVLYLDMQKSEIFPETPSFGDLNLPKDKLIYAESMSYFGQLGRLLAGPPKLDKKMENHLKSAIWQALSDPDYLATTKKFEQDVEPLKGDASHDLVIRTLNAPPEIQQIIKDAFKQE